MRIPRPLRCVATLVLLAGCPAEVPPGDGGEGSSTTDVAPVTMSTSATTTAPQTNSTTLSGTGTGTDDSASETAADTTQGGFFGNRDMGSEGGTCDVFNQDCPEGEKCTPWAADGGQSWNATTCRPVVRIPGQVGDPCTVEGSAVSGVDDCDVGAMCYNVSAKTNIGRCFELCSGSAENPMCEEGLCAIYNDGNLPLCLFDCDPLLSDCGPEQLCLASPSANGFVCILDSLPASTGDYGAPCEFVNTCDPGYFCAVPSVVAGCLNPGGCCAEFCDITLPDPSSQCTGQLQGEECQPWYGMDEPPPGYEHVGFCGIPS